MRDVNEVLWLSSNMPILEDLKWEWFCSRLFWHQLNRIKNKKPNDKWWDTPTHYQKGMVWCESINCDLGVPIEENIIMEQKPKSVSYMQHQRPRSSLLLGESLQAKSDHSDSPQHSFLRGFLSFFLFLFPV